MYFSSKVSTEWFVVLDFSLWSWVQRIYWLDYNFFFFLILIILISCFCLFTCGCHLRIPKVVFNSFFIQNLSVLYSLVLENSRVSVGLWIEASAIIVRYVWIPCYWIELLFGIHFLAKFLLQRVLFLSIDQIECAIISFVSFFTARSLFLLFLITFEFWIDSLI